MCKKLTSKMVSRSQQSERERLRQLHHAATDIMAATDEASVYERIIATADTVLGFDFCTVFRYDSETFKVAASSFRSQGETFDRFDGFLLKSLETQQSYVTPDLHGNSLAKPEREEFRSGITVPLNGNAVLQAVSRQVEYYDETDLELAELLAVHAEAALSQVRSQNRLLEQKEKIESLHEIAAEIESCRVQDELYSLMRKASEEILGYDWCTFYLYKDAEFITAMASEESPMHVGERPFPNGNSVARTVVETGESCLISDRSETKEGEPTTSRITSAMQVPVGDVGVYCVANERPDSFDEADLELAELLCSHVAEAYQRIETQQRLKQQKRELERKNERLDRFTSILSHDLRNPLNVAQLRASLVKQTADIEHIDDVIDAHERMDVMIDDLLTMARAKQLDEQKTTVSLATRAENAWETTKTGESELGIEDTNGLSLTAEPSLLQHLLENLFRNAVEHNENPVTITVGTLGPAEYPHGFYVEDDGVGFPDGQVDEIFEHGYSTSERGIGLGLSIVAEFVDAHDWDISARESAAGGARFDIYTGTQ